jgi:hypothetical protein
MKLVIRVLAAALIVSAMPSCKKEDANNNSYTGTLLSKVIVWTSNPFQSKAIIEVYKYHYDALNRVTEIAYSNGDSAKGESGAKYLNSKKWFYKGDEQLPYKCTDVNDSALLSELYFLYDNQGRLVSDSLPTTVVNTFTVRKYNWFPDRVLTITASHEMGIIAMSTDSIQINSQNYLAQFGTSSSFGLGIPALYFTYDNKINPLHKLNIHAAISLSAIGGVPNFGYSENNKIEVKTGYLKIFGVPAGTFSQSGTFSYTYNYNAHNLPVDFEITGNLPNPSKIKFYYNN